MQVDGNAVVYDGATAIYDTQTTHKGNGPWRFEAQLDGNLVIYSPGFETPHTWASAKQHGNPAKLVMQDDGNLVYYAHDGFPIWASKRDVDKIGSGMTLFEGQYIKSQNGRFRFVMQGDGNAVLYKDAVTPLWSTASSGKGIGPYRFATQSDGNLVVYSASGHTWASGTGHGAPGHLVVQDDGNLVFYSKNNQPIWNSGTRA
jgi:hypothetical protein